MILFAYLGALIILIVLWDTFETIVLPRTVTRRLRLTLMFYRMLRSVWRVFLHFIHPGPVRNWVLAVYGPLSLILLFAFWAAWLIFGFGLLLWGLKVPVTMMEGPPDLGTTLYFSGVTFLTLGFGDVTARTPLGRGLSVLEAGIGFGFLAIVISYLPVIYQAFSHREAMILLLDARAGTPPSAGELLRRHAQAHQFGALLELLRTLEQWSAELLESCLSYPVLVFYRSQHEEVSWLSALTCTLDTCSLIRAGLERDEEHYRALVWQAQLTFAMARHTLVDIAYILNIPPQEVPDRLPAADWQTMSEQLRRAGLALPDSALVAEHLQTYRQQYEPFVYGLAKRLYLDVPPWYEAVTTTDNWQTSAWDDEQHLNLRPVK